MGDFVEMLLCRTIGCRSVFARWSGLPWHACNRFMIWRCARG